MMRQVRGGIEFGRNEGVDLGGVGGAVDETEVRGFETGNFCWDFEEHAS